MKTYFIDQEQFDKKSVDMAESFLRRCINLLGENSFLWVAFQSNTFCDRCNVSETFGIELEEMIENLGSELSIFIPALNKNMRNSREVAELAETIRSERGARKVTKLQKCLPSDKSSITSTKPTLFPIEKAKLKENFEDLFKLATEDAKINVILFSHSNDMETFSLEEIMLVLIRCGVEEKDIFIHSYESNKSKEEVKEFLNNPNGFLVCQDELFCGMEANSLVYCVSDYDHYRNIRVNMMRACSQLNIIHAYRKDFNAFIDFPSANLNPRFMTNCDKEMYIWAIKCLTCQTAGDNINKENYWICKSCFLGCHSGHDVESKSIKRDLKRESVRCHCRLKSQNCIFNK